MHAKHAMAVKTVMHAKAAYLAKRATYLAMTVTHAKCVLVVKAHATHANHVTLVKHVMLLAMTVTHAKCVITVITMGSRVRPCIA